jgi:Spy/CpxP family protein refolding chaperone
MIRLSQLSAAVFPQQIAANEARNRRGNHLKFVGVLVMKLNSNCFALSIAALVALTASSAFAQGGGGKGFGGRGFGGGFAADPTMLLGQDPVQKELELSDAQKTQLTQLADDARQARRDLFQNGGAQEDNIKKMTEMAAANKKKVAEILAPPQSARLDEIMLQYAVYAGAAGALTQDPTAEKLALTAEQKQKLTDLQTSNGEKMREIFQNAQGDFQGMQEKMGKLRDEQKTAAMDVLTSEQKEKLEKLQGKKFDVASIQLGGRRPGGKGGN